jgi:hypothetical protein
MSGDIRREENLYYDANPVVNKLGTRISIDVVQAHALHDGNLLVHLFD